MTVYIMKENIKGHNGDISKQVFVVNAFSSKRADELFFGYTGMINTLRISIISKFFYPFMKNFSETDLKLYLSKISDEKLYAYNVYQIEGEGRNLFSKIDGDADTIMGLPIKKIKEYLKDIK